LLKVQNIEERSLALLCACIQKAWLFR
jgi:hypothetical protein